MRFQLMKSMGENVMGHWKIVLWTTALAVIFSGTFAVVCGQQASPKKTTATKNVSQSPEAEAPTPQIEEQPPVAPVNAVPVAPFHQTICYIYAQSGPFSPKERAVNLEYKIYQLSEDIAFTPEKLKVVSTGTSLDIVYEDTVVMSISDADALAMNISLEEVAEYYRSNIADAIEQYRKTTELPTILTKVGLVVLILAAFFFIVRYVNELFRAIRRKVVSLKGTVIKGVRIKSYDVLDEKRCIIVVLFVVRIIKYLLLLTIFYISITLLFSVFPETRGLANKLLDYVLTPFSNIVFSVIDYIPNAIAIVVIVTIFRYLIKGIRYFAGEIEKGNLVISGFYQDWALPTYNIVRTLLFAFMFVVIYDYLPSSESTIFKGVSVFLGVIVSLGSTSLIGNLMSGLVLTYMRPFRVGDFVKIGEISGTVREKTPFAVRVTTAKNEEITIPNVNIMSSHTTNYSYSAHDAAVETRLILHASITFGYDTPWRQVHELLLDAATKTKYVLADPKPFVLQNALDSFFVEYSINVYVQEEKRMLGIRSELYANIQDVFKEAGLDMVCPTFQNIVGENKIAVSGVSEKQDLP